MAKILITGSSGTIGRSLLNRLVDMGTGDDYICIMRKNNHIPDWPHILTKCKRLSFWEGDLTSESDLDRIFKANPKIEKVVHLAANASPKSGDINGMYDLNLKATHYLLQRCETGVEFIYASSVLYYGENGGYHESDRPNPKTLYAITKVASEQLINIYAEQGKIRPRILRFCGVVGPYMRHGRIHQAAQHNLKHETMNLMGRAPGSFSPLLHVDDAVDALLLALNCNRARLCVNICPDDYISLQNALEFVNPNITLNWDGIGNINAMNCYNDTARIELGWRPKYNSEQALRRFIEERETK